MNLDEMRIIIALQCLNFNSLISEVVVCNWDTVIFCCFEYERNPTVCSVLE